MGETSTRKDQYYISLFYDMDHFLRGFYSLTECLSIQGKINKRRSGKRNGNAMLKKFISGDKLVRIEVNILAQSARIWSPL